MIELIPWLCVWWGLHRLWTLRRQTMGMWNGRGSSECCYGTRVTFTEARVWFCNAEQSQAAHTAERFSMWFWQHRQHMLGKDPAVNAARLRAVRAAAAVVGRKEAHERRTKIQRKENARRRQQERQRSGPSGTLGPRWQRSQISGCQRSPRQRRQSKQQTRGGRWRY